MRNPLEYIATKAKKYTTTTTTQTPRTVRIEVKAGNLGTLHHYALKIPVRIVKRRHIEVHHVG